MTSEARRLRSGIVMSRRLGFLARLPRFPASLHNCGLIRHERRSPQGCQKRRCAAFTLAEVLAALVFMAIVIPVAVEGIQIAGRAGQVAARKGEAALVAERLLNEITLTNQATQSTLNGVLRQGAYQYRWQMRNEPWDKDALRLVSIQVTFAVQGQDYDVRLSTLVDNSSQTGTSQSAATQ